ncbi:MAG: electron transfer flavoprotein subunit beta/FixA family protein [Eubacterium sp.]|nr:electron transfer flavoprotein subunit beta/FixA family protein [Eubacterium sp.]
MKIAVCIKSVPDPEYYEKITIDPESKRLVRDGIPAVINEADKHAIEAALRFKETEGGEITLLSMGPPAARDQLMEGLAMGADKAFLISDRKVGGADSLATAYTLRKLVESTGEYDVILTGNESADGATAHVPSQLGVWLGAAHATNVVDLAWDNGLVVTKAFEKGRGRYRLSTPCVVGVTAKANEVRFNDVRTILDAKNKQLDILSAADLKELNDKYIGLAGSPSQNGEVETVSGNKECLMLTGTESEIADQIAAIIRGETLGKEEA